MPDLPRLHLVLVEPEIPGNSGNVGRLCAASGVRLHFVGKLGFDLSDKALKRAGLDYWPLLDWTTWADLDALRAQADPGAGWHFFTTKTKRFHTAARYRAGDYLVFGKETKGLPEALLAAHADACVTIPMRNPGVRSLNLATSVGIGVYEALRQIEGWQ
ncbi:tRNA (cytidine/uridine-2'-O-)-methyltransferase [Verrucomicrobium sp. GAS474]|uniref:tRNA (cytidine(34)-2'-O)-methyltransferase n=1 Tax=Verrucomicrobium sp. GAS474 TaxID=1882831 RepID=UPI00087A93AC|nr:tRNA (cytidine(34)-2'-O)-methyltransferase [Verrucomicrobium sp. GAS474]SDU00603.1 tRNA (cytidine/uridine-2'-O-)-methyltransferase [Verrucomicrobium sp. GAS474]